MDFALRLKELRIKAGLTQETLAQRAELSARSVRDIERRRVRFPRPETARLLGDALGLDDTERADFLSLARQHYWAHRRDRESSLDHDWECEPVTRGRPVPAG